jgi:hypothetical protein
VLGFLVAMAVASASCLMPSEFSADRAASAAVGAERLADALERANAAGAPVGLRPSIWHLFHAHAGLAPRLVALRGPDAAAGKPAALPPPLVLETGSATVTDTTDRPRTRLTGRQEHRRNPR